MAGVKCSCCRRREPRPGKKTCEFCATRVALAGQGVRAGKTCACGESIGNAAVACVACLKKKFQTLQSAEQSASKMRTAQNLRSTMTRNPKLISKSVTLGADGKPGKGRF